MAIGGELVYNGGQDLREVRRKLLFRHPGFLGQSVDDLRPGQCQLPECTAHVRFWGKADIDLEIF